MIDRATGHLEALEKATCRGRMPTKMAINIKSLVLNKDNEQFKREWQAVFQIGGNKLLKETVWDGKLKNWSLLMDFKKGLKRYLKKEGLIPVD